MFQDATKGASFLSIPPAGRAGTMPFGVVPGPTPVANRGNIMSMSTALGGKAKEFGKAIPAKKAKKKKPAKKRKPRDNNDYEQGGTNI